MKVCFLIDSLAPGGAERSTANLAIWLKQRGHDVHMAMLHDRRPGFADEVCNEGVPVSYLGLTWRDRVSGLRHLLKQGQFDLLHSCLFSSNFLARCASLPLFRPSWALSCSIVNNSYGPHRQLDHGVKPWKLALVKLIDRFSLHLSSPIVHAVTRSAALNAVEHLHLRSSDLSVVYRGRPQIHVDVCRSDLRLSLGLTTDAPVFIHVARQELQKNHLGLIAAFEQAWLKRPDVRLLLVGREGNASPAIHQQLNASPARDAILCLGHRADVPELLRCADFFVLPSHYEGLSGAMIEAMEAGLPVICSDLDGLREGCEPDRSALLCNPGEPATIAATMTRLLDDPELARRLGARGREIFLERFTLEASCLGMLEFFESAIAKRKRSVHPAHK